MVIVLIRTRMKADCDRTAYDALNARMFEIVQRIPGFVSVTGYANGVDGEIGVVRFESLDALRAWREHPEHVVVQERGRAEFYGSYTIEVCEVLRVTAFDARGGEPTRPPQRHP